MYPNNNQPIPSDYLNQIAPPPPKKVSFVRKQPILVGVICLVLVLIIFTILGSSSGNTKPPEQLAARLIATNVVVDDATSKIKNNQLRALNSDLKLCLTNAVRDIAAPLIEINLNIKKLNKKVVLAESNAELLVKLEDARLNGVYDRTYAREMTYKLSTILTLMQQVNSSTKNKDLKNFLDNTTKNLQPIQKRFADFNTAAS